MRLKPILLLAVVSIYTANLVAQEATPEATAPVDAAVTAPATNTEWTPVFETVNGVEMALVPAGTFTMGTSEEDVDALFADCESVLGAGNCTYEWFGRETPQSQVTLTAPYWISKTEITNEQYAQCVAADGCTPPSDVTQFNDPAFASYPVVYVTWEQANQYADWFGGRLPTEAEWEYAARGVDSSVYPWGDAFDPSQANFCDTTCPRDWRAFEDDDGNPELAPVNSYPSGSWVGAVDLVGNVSEWTMTRYHESLYVYPYSDSDGRNDRVTERQDARVARGGSWEDVARDNRAAARDAVPYPMDGANDIGFRVVVDYTS